MSGYGEILRELCPEMPEMDIPELTPEEYEAKRAEWYNAVAGTLNEKDGIECSICHNKGTIQRPDGSIQECECMNRRRSVQGMKISGLGGLLSKSFESFVAEDPWQIRAKKMTMHYAATAISDWMYFGGQHGCGKTHLCTAVCKALIDRGRLVKYMLWNDISQKLSAYKYKADEYAAFLDSIKTVDVLYIDDFLKTPTNGENIPEKPSAEELHNAYVVINARYFADKLTIISSEHFLSEYEDYDGAASGRIKEKASATIQILRSPERNYRKR